MTKTIILGGGIAGLSLASFLDHETVVLERDHVFGGLSRSYQLDGIAYDVGPHIIFSKNKEVLDLHTSMIPTEKIRRSNVIFYKGKYIKYPFENDLASLPPDECDYCLQEFLNNPYESLIATNMLQFFLKTFGEGITRTYLQPYNEKIWKFDPSCMDTQMVERIPKPPKEDVIASAKGVATEGYVHQLYFHYPETGGFQTLVDAYLAKAQYHGEVRSSTEILSIEGGSGDWTVRTTAGDVQGEQLINCIPMHELFKYLSPPPEVAQALFRLKFNSIHVTVINMKKDAIGDHFALYFSEPDLIFHRLSKLNFLGDGYKRDDGGSTLLAEVTFRPESYLGTIAPSEVEKQVIDDLVKTNLINRNDIVSVETRTFKYAYVIYDLEHRKNADTVLNYLRSIGIYSAGRFAEFEYLNTDGVVESTLKLSRELNAAQREA